MATEEPRSLQQEHFCVIMVYELDIGPEEENAELRKMLSEIKKHRRDLEPTIMKQLFLYISKRMNKYEPKT